MSGNKPSAETSSDNVKEVDPVAPKAKLPETGKDEAEREVASEASEEKSPKTGTEVKNEAVPGASAQTLSDSSREESSKEAETGTPKETTGDVSKEEAGKKAEQGAPKESSGVSQAVGSVATASGTAKEMVSSASQTEDPYVERVITKSTYSKSAEYRKTHKGKSGRGDTRLAEKLAAEKRQQEEKPWLKDGDLTYLDDAVDPDYVSRWPYKSYKVTVHIALPHVRKEPLFSEYYAKYIAAELDMKPENFRVKTIMNPFHPEDWEEPEEDEEPLYIQLIVEGDIRNKDLMDWNDKFKDAVCNMEEEYSPGNILVFFFGLHTKPLPTGNRRREIDEEDDMYW